MCGISGIIGFSDKEEVSRRIQTMTDAIAHRGPDDQGIYVDDFIALGHRRLAIIDLSSAGHQPMWDFEKRYTIVYNGEIYNFKEIKSQINDYPFQSNSDTEVLLAAYRKWGSGMLEKLAGMFAFAIFDKVTNETFIARDRLGIKPLYYYHQNGVFVFSSEVRSLLKSGFLKAALNHSALGDYFSYQTIHAPNTIIENVFCLMPGHFALIKNKELNIHKYWSLQNSIDKDAIHHSIDQIKSNVKSLLYQAVERRLVSDVDFGAFLSGGIDSSAVVAIMSEVHSKKVKTFNVSFDESEFSEARFANIIAKKYNTDHTEIRLSPQMFLESLPEALSALDHPSGDGPNSYIVSKATKKGGITMALSGLGGDELFAGYPVFKRMHSNKALNLFTSLPKPLRQSAAGVLAYLNKGPASKKLLQISQAKNSSFEELYPIWRKIASQNTINKLLSYDDTHTNFVSKIISSETSDWSNFSNHNLSKISIAEMTTYMQNVLLRDTDQMSMAVALEVRVPFLDHHLVEYVLGVSDHHKFPSYPKKLLIESIEELLPREIVHRPKMGFVLPWEHWLKNEMRSFCSERIDALSQRSFIDEKQLLKRWNQFLKGRKDIRWNDMWICIVLEDYIQKNNLHS
ncbi:MAG TPA: asparagine synthase (glutamine-hydrolyzing) [Bacteroidia bacterium]|nr:asparagine synthase (glutamine-hydrolyzing) [Bacteroidia bacterium]HNT79082.1 asparagine synthase (glutamine-hydrolyzing) [Bacteroidia bacterium]